MSYATANVVSDPAPMTTLMTALEGLLSGNAAWSFVEETVYTTYTCRIWKCSGDANGTGMDFYIALNRTTTTKLTTSTLIITAGEVYNLTTHKFLRPAFLSSSTTTVGADESYGAVELAPMQAPIAQTMPCLVSTTVFSYWIQVTKFGITIRTSTTVWPVCVGLYEPFYVLNNGYPLIVAVFSGSANSGSSRRPGSAGLSSAYWSALNVLYPLTSVYTKMIGAIPSGATTLGGRSVGARVLVQFYLAYPDGSTDIGLLRNMLVFNQDAAVSLGDTITVGGNTYVCVYDGGAQGLWVDTSAA